MKILLVEDDRDLGRIIKEELEQKKYFVSWVQDISESRLQIQNFEYNLAIIDLNLPDGTGFDLIPFLGCPVIIMSALSDPQNRLMGARIGAYDFIPKPFLLQELFLKIERILGEELEKNKIWQQNDVILDLNKREIRTTSEIHLLNKRDFRLLDILSSHFPQVVSRDQMMDYVYGKDQNPSQRSIDNAVVGIRQMLKDEKHEWIRSVRGEGYQWMLKGK
jgi:DNA-binding response OmpR family regulator